MEKPKPENKIERSEKTSRVRVHRHGNEKFIQIRVQRIENGYLLRTGSEPIHYPTIESLADAVRNKILETESEWGRKNQK